MRSGRTVVLLILAMLVPATGVAGCGGDGGGADTAQTVLKDTFGPGHPIRSGRLSLSLRVAGSGAGLGEPVVVNLSGPFISAGPDTLPRFALRARIGEADQAAAGLVSTGRQGFVTVGRQAFVLTEDAYRRLQQRYRTTQRQNREQGKATPGLSALGIRPGGWLTDATATSDADVAGTPTTRVSGALNVDALLSDIDRLLARAGAVPGTAATARLPKRLDPALKEALSRSVTTAKISVDAGRSDRTLRRITLRLVLRVAPEDQKALGGLKTLDVDLDLAIADLGKVQTIPTPRNARPLSELGTALSGLTAGGAKPAPPAATTTAPAPAPSAGTPKEYTDCLQRAGGDVGAIQRCADLINR